MKTIRIDGVIGQGNGEVSADSIRAQLPTNGEPIRVSIHSEGGSVFEGFAIHDLFANYSGPKTIAVESTAFSIASFIAMAFDEIEMSPNAYLMLHNPRVGVDGDDEELASTAGMISQLKNNMVTAYATRSGKSIEEVTAILKAETYMSASEAVASGFADRITEKPVRARAFAQLEKMPHGVVTALFGAGSGGDNDSTKGNSMSESQTVAATVRDIKAAFPKAKSDFIVKCLERNLPLASVATAAAEEMMAENEELMKKVEAMEKELEEARARAMEDEEEPSAEEDEEEPSAEEDEEEPSAEYDEENDDEPAARGRRKAKARGRRKAKARRATGVRPIARGTSSRPSASARWESAIEDAMKKTNGNKMKAVALANRTNPGLREAVIAEANRR